MGTDGQGNDDVGDCEQGCRDRRPQEAAGGGGEAAGGGPKGEDAGRACANVGVRGCD